MMLPVTDNKSKEPCEKTCSFEKISGRKLMFVDFELLG